MKVLVITGSAHGKGTSALMADEFIRGAKCSCTVRKQATENKR